MEFLPVAVFLIFFSLALALGGVNAVKGEKKKKIESRLQSFPRAGHRTGDPPGGSPGPVSPGPGKKRPFLQAASRYLAPRRWIKKAEAGLAQSDIPLRPEEFVTLQVLLVLGAATSLALFRAPLILTAVVVTAAGLAPSLVVKRAKAQRVQKFDLQLGEGLTVMSNSLRAGLSFMQAMDTLSKETPPPLAGEFGRVIKEMSLGATTEEALDNLQERVGSRDLDLVITAVKIQRQVGGNLSEILDKIGDTIQQRIRLRGELKVLTAQGRVSGMVIGLLPLFIIAIISFINPGYMADLFTHPLGMVMLGWGVVSEVTGLLVIRKVVNIQF